ncbi:MAG: hypothetical protein EOO24_46185 [Comamonadaceae bacterium]|nr:MAG: hypothetical protein EOO24_46185 [Comamonadaceae bacterium]
MPEDRTPIDHGLAHPQAEPKRIPEADPQPRDGEAELVPNQRTHRQQTDEAGGHTNFVQQPD